MSPRGLRSFAPHPIFCRWRRGAWPMIGLALVLLGTLLGGNATASAEAAPSGSGSMMQAVSAMNAFSATGLPPAQLDAQLGAMAAAGVRVVRSDAAWSTIEPQPPGATGHHWQFATTDAWVGELARNHLTWEPIVDYAVGWAKSCPGFCPPDSDATYAAFAQAVAARYGEGGAFWKQNPGLPAEPAQVFEIWNEENTPAFSVPASRYVKLYAAARAAIHVVDPTASVDVGGLADDSQAFDIGHDYPAWFVEQMFAADPSIAGQIDAFALHPYGATAADVISWVSDFRRVLDLYGVPRVPVDITEVGWTHGVLDGDLTRATMMQTLASTLARTDCGIRLLAPYTWINPLALGGSGDFGLVDRSGLSAALRPAGTAWFSGLTQALTLPKLELCPFLPAAGTAPAGGTTAGQGASSKTGTPNPKPKPKPKRCFDRHRHRTRCPVARHQRTRRRRHPVSRG